MDYTHKFMSNEHQEQYRSASESADPSSVSPMLIHTSPKSPRSPKSPNSPRGKPCGGSPLQAHSGRAGDPKKGEHSILLSNGMIDADCYGFHLHNEPSVRWVLDFLVVTLQAAMVGKEPGEGHLIWKMGL